MGQIAELIKRVLSGDEPTKALGPSWRADLAMPIHERAKQILKMPREHRRKEIEKCAPEIRVLLANEVKRLYTIRK